jgi:hypothetical protein
MKLLQYQRNHWQGLFVPGRIEMAQELSALAALVGVAISALISWALSKREIKKMRLELKRAYESRLIEERLKRYPGFFALLSQFIKDIEFGSVSRETVESLLAAANEWDSQNAIFLSDSAANNCYGYRHDLDDVIKSTSPFSNDLLDELRAKTRDVEYALRSDIGIYGISNEGDHDLVRVDSYESLRQKMRQEFKDIKRDLKESQRESQQSAQ